jgi:hypothetical protein
MTLASHPVVCQVDQDVELLPGWMPRVVDALERDPQLGAVEGQYTVNPAAPAIARVMALDLEQRYDAARDRETTHVCTGNTRFAPRRFGRREVLTNHSGTATTWT